MTLFREPADLEDGWCVPKNRLPQVRIEIHFILKGEGMGVALHTSWCRNPFFLQPTLCITGQGVPVGLQQNCYCLFSNFLSLYDRDSVILWTFRTLTMEYCVFFRLLKQQQKKNPKLMSSDPIASRQIDGKKAQMVATFLLFLNIWQFESWCIKNKICQGKKWTKDSSVQFSRSVVSDSSDPMNCSPPGSSVHGIFQAKVLE